MSRLTLLGICLVGTIVAQLSWACTAHNCENPCKVVTYLHVAGDGFQYVGGKATLIDHLSPSAGGSPGSARPITVKFWDLMCLECAGCAGSTCEGSNPGTLLLTKTESHWASCTGGGGGGI